MTIDHITDYIEENKMMLLAAELRRYLHDKSSATDLPIIIDK
jgi:hypothetical protein